VSYLEFLVLEYCSKTLVKFQCLSDSNLDYDLFPHNFLFLNINIYVLSLYFKNTSEVLLRMF